MWLGVHSMATEVTDNVLVAFHQACNDKNLELAEQLFGLLGGTADAGHAVPSVDSAYERLWLLRNIPR
jgi:hypothetical protein